MCRSYIPTTQKNSYQCFDETFPLSTSLLCLIHTFAKMTMFQVLSSVKAFKDKIEKLWHPRYLPFVSIVWYIQLPVYTIYIHAIRYTMRCDIHRKSTILKLIKCKSRTLIYIEHNIGYHIDFVYGDVCCYMQKTLFEAIWSDDMIRFDTLKYVRYAWNYKMVHFVSMHTPMYI